MKENLIDPDLFGNDAGEDEPLHILDSYFLDKTSFDPFFNPNVRLSFARSKKGMGKSSLLRQAYYEREKTDNGDILISLKASDLVALQDIDTTSPSTMIHGWQQRICSRINFEIGSNLKIAIRDDATSLIEGSELSGFRGRNIVSCLVDRITLKLGGNEVARNKLTSENQQALLSRYSKDKSIRVWIFIDDVDATFINTNSERLSISTFFSACRNITSTINGINIRASVRTDVWSVIGQYDEALDKCEQYMVDIHWSTEESGKILRNKIKSYFKRIQKGAFSTPDRDISKLIFKEPFHWSGRSLESFRPIHILSAGRPRWASKLCRLAGKLAHSVNHDKITGKHVYSVLKDYGKSRLLDLYKEHRHQCDGLEHLIESFSGKTSKYPTTSLLAHIKNNIISKTGPVKIDGISSISDEITIAHFLFRIGFISARDETDATGLGFVTFEDRPHLLTTTQNLDDGLPWEIHPSYRSVLRISTTDIREELNI